MRMVLALVFFVATAATSIAIAETSPRTGKPSKLPLLCSKSAEKVSGLTKICYYSCAKSEGALTTTTYEACPGWTPRWRLNRTAKFEPSGNSR
jgi:hypothetical protein